MRVDDFLEDQRDLFFGEILVLGSCFLRCLEFGSQIQQSDKFALWSVETTSRRSRPFKLELQTLITDCLLLCPPGETFTGQRSND